MLYCACPCLPSVPRVGPQQVVTQDMTSDSVPFFGSDSSPCQDFVCYLTRSLDTSCKVSSDRHSGVAPFPRFRILDPFPGLRNGSPGPGWCLNSSHQTDARLDLLDRDTWPDCFPTLLLGHGYGIVPEVGCCVWCHYYLFYLYCLYFIAHPTILLMLESCYVSVQVTYLLDMLFLN